MGTPDFQTFQTFYNKEEAQPLIDFFEENNIRCRFEANYDVFHLNADQIELTLGEPVENEWALRISSGDFEKANELLQKEAEKVTEIPEEHYIHQFDNNELKDMIQKPDEWSRQDVHLARLLLKKRGE